MASSNVWEKTLKCKGNKEYNTIRISVYYDLGGMNYFNGNVDKRGYWLSVRPSFISKENGYTSETFAICGGGGYRHFLVECSRKSKKKAEEAIEKGKEFYPQILDRVCIEQRLHIVEDKAL